MHKIQLKILKKLLYHPSLRFRDLHDKNYTSEHFTYHLNQLVKKKFLCKEKNQYKLTDKGKNYVGKLDEKTLEEERGPKVSVLIFVRKKGESGEWKYLMHVRKKQPYYGKVGGFTGKVRFGESFYEAAERELLEETGLRASLKLIHIYHKIRNSKDGKTLQDSIFLIFLAESPQGELIDPKEADLFWTTKKDLFERKDLFDDLKDKWKLIETLEELKVVEDISVSKGY